MSLLVYWLTSSCCTCFLRLVLRSFQFAIRFSFGLYCLHRHKSLHLFRHQQSKHTIYIAYLPPCCSRGHCCTPLLHARERARAPVRLSGRAPHGRRKAVAHRGVTMQERLFLAACLGDWASPLRLENQPDSTQLEQRAPSDKERLF